jgi:ribosomal protein L29
MTDVSFKPNRNGDALIVTPADPNKYKELFKSFGNMSMMGKTWRLKNPERLQELKARIAEMNSGTKRDEVRPDTIDEIEKQVKSRKNQHKYHRAISNS